MLLIFVVLFALPVAFVDPVEIPDPQRWLLRVCGEERVSVYGRMDLRDLDEADLIVCCW